MTDQRDVERGAGETPETHDELAELRAMLKKVNAESAGRRKELEAMQAKLDDAETTKLKDQQKWQELAEKLQKERDDLAPFKTQAESVGETLQALLDAQLADLPEEARVMVAEMPGTAQEKLNWLAKNRARLTKPLAPDMGAGARGDKTTPINLSQAENQMAAAFKISREHFSQKKKELGTRPQFSFKPTEE